MPMIRESRIKTWPMPLALALCLASARADDATSTCPVLTVNDPASTCYVATPAAGAPVIDNTAGTGDWAGAVVKNLHNGGIDGTIRFLRNGEDLYLMVTVNDATNSEQDFVEIHFDPMHNLGTTGDDVDFKIFRPEGSHPGPHKINGAGDNPWSPAAGVLGSFSAAASWNVKVKITAAELGLPYLTSVIGFGVQASDNPASNLATWPNDFNDAAPATSWAILKNRRPIDYALSLDFSGSMEDLDGVAVSRWKRAVRAADMFATVAGLFRNAVYYPDSIITSRYAWDCLVEASSGDGTAQFTARTVLPSGGGSIFPGSADTDPPGNNCTPIKRGLKFALANQLGFGTARAGLARDRILVLLSDGFHNMPSADMASFNLDPKSHFSADELKFASVRTVALGPDGSAGTELLAKIATAFHNDIAPSHEAKYIQLGAADNLLDAYLETLEAPLHINRIFPASGKFTVDAVEKLVFIAAWSNPADANALVVKREGVTVSPTATLPPNTQIGYAAVVFDNPQPSANWEVIASGAGFAKIFAAVDLRLFAEFPTEQKIYHAGDPMLLQVRLQDKERPLTGAEVKVEIARPGEGLGNFLTLHAPDCKRVEPSVPIALGSVPRLFDRDGGMASGASLAVAGQPGSRSGASPEPLPGRYAMARGLIDRCGALPRDTLPGVPLYDDATHGDLIAGDGIYSLSYQDTQKEGTYTFRFFARGKTADSVGFNRLALFSHYVSIAPSPEASPVSFVPTQATGAWQQAVAFVLPKDALGNYLGPGYAGAFQVSVAGGLAQGTLVDLGNGVYGQGIRYPKGGNPDVTISIPDLCFHTHVGPGGGHHQPPCPDHACPWIWIILILLLLLLIILWLLLRKP